MDRSLDSLDPRFKPLAMELVARCVEKGILVIIVNTRRTEAEQAQAVATGHSKVAHSKHEDGLAIDIAPVAEYYRHGGNKLDWDDTDPVWFDLGRLGEALGLRWGGRFTPLNSVGLGWDAGHFEYVEPKKTTTPVPV